MSIDYSILSFPKPKNKKRKKETVSKETYNTVYKRDKETCQLADFSCEGRLELHHIVYRSEDKKRINDVDNCIMLCTKHHKLVHSNKRLYQPILIEKISRRKEIKC